ncbi:SAM-dependent methyltransferase [Candidatus Magnetaquicoccus inordinatus]|uniref:SAM-dependent methyltransferase n=1 Tax=Candidatus Magnetaquicoccus inordinatus TaxID=2496818 RepID=UPI00102D2823|nr:class I SAM-dependent methyltransferase [Candidatus Magnetaquicoccus inordinatus]
MSELAKPRQEGDFPHWETLYQTEPVEKMPWYTTAADQDLQRVIESHALRSGHFLDVGTGPGTQAAWLAAQGLKVTATDLSPAAVAAAAAYAQSQGVTVTTLVDDILHSGLTGPFDAVLDRGCFHVLPPESRATYVQTIYRLLQEQGLLLLKCFSLQESTIKGPYRFSPETLHPLFADHCRTLQQWESHYEGSLPQPPKALFTLLQSRKGA